jgi:putative transposase
MGYKTSDTNCVVRLVPLDLNRAQERQCEALRREAGQAWTDMLKAHIESRSGKWLTANDLMRDFKGCYALHSQSVQALAQKLEANVDTARKNRQGGDTEARYPYKEKSYQTVTWKEQGLRQRGRRLFLSNGRGRDPLILSLPAEYRSANIRKAELLWRADHYELALTIDTGTSNPPLIRRVKTAGVDLGEINIAAVVTEAGEGVVITGRYLRSIKRLRNKRHTAYVKRMTNCLSGSRRMKRLRTRKAQASAKFYRQQRNILHRASRKVVEFCRQAGVARIAIGDVRDIADGTDKGRHQNQRMSQWPHGQFVQYVSYKGRVFGMATDYQSEDFSSRTCSVCGQVRSSSPRGRLFSCPGCGVVVSRDGNGGANICSRARYGTYSKVQITHLTYLRPVAVVAPGHGPTLLA